MGCEETIQIFFMMALHIKLYHWQTTSYARHKATDDLHGTIQELSDKYIETYMGRYSRPRFSSRGFDIKVVPLTDDSIGSLIKKFIKFLEDELPKTLKSSDTDLLNIRDDLLGHLNQVLYLFTLN